MPPPPLPTFQGKPPNFVFLPQNGSTLYQPVYYFNNTATSVHVPITEVMHAPYPVNTPCQQPCQHTLSTTLSTPLVLHPINIPFQPTPSIRNPLTPLSTDDVVNT